MVVIKTIDDAKIWDRLVREHGGHPLQLWSWGELKTAHGAWTATRLAIYDGTRLLGGAQVLTRRLPWPFCRILYVPRGPFGEENNREKVLRELGAWAKQQGAVELKIEPDWTNESAPLHVKSWHMSRGRILMPRTVRLDLALTEENLLDQMSKKTRQYIRKSEHDGVKVRRITVEKDVKTALKIYRDTAARDHFPLHDDTYYLDLARLGGEHNQIWLAEKDGQPLAFLWNLATEAVCFELYGGVNGEGQRLRANFALKWQAIKFACENGAKVYDLNGLLNDGVSGFKLGFGAPSELIGTYDLPLSQLYSIYENLLPLGKKIVKKFVRPK